MPRISRPRCLWFALVVCTLALSPTGANAATNNIFTVAGTGTAGFSGDGAAGTAAQLNNPTGVAATADGGFLIADPGNRRVRRVSPRGRSRPSPAAGRPASKATAARRRRPSSTTPRASHPPPTAAS